jgi:hypothetical protein
MDTPTTARSPLDAVLALAEAQPDVRSAATALRQRCPGTRIVVVDAFDMPQEPAAAVGSKVAIWYGASDGHCWTVTTDPARAAGLFIAAAP